jgi:outer membrane protein OmpA-like peptidoglycan-associated protein
MVCRFLIAVFALASAGNAQDFWVNRGPFYAFFDWSKATLTADARANLDNAAAAYQMKPGQIVELIGRSDRSGPASSNVRSSRMRAEAVRAYLVLRSVPSDRIRIRAVGESQPIIPTENGVREAQNRSVEVWLIG